MWFVMPKGCESITVEQQAFGVEFRDKNGKCYFRAPDHFSTRILAISGFDVVEQPEGALADLPKADPLRDGAIAELTTAVQSFKVEVHNLRSDLNAAHAKVSSLAAEKIELAKERDDALAEAQRLREQLEDNGETVVPLKKAGK